MVIDTGNTFAPSLARLMFGMGDMHYIRKPLTTTLGRIAQRSVVSGFASLLIPLGTGAVPSELHAQSGPPTAGSAASCQGTAGYAHYFRRTFLWRPEWLQQIKADPAARKTIIAPLLADAERALKQRPLSVMDKSGMPASGDKHDYYSLAPYWWPAPGKPGGKPYVRDDGKVNPERSGNEYDASKLMALRDAIRTLSLAYYYSDDPRYARHAAQLIRTWFLDPATKMNPNLAYAQAVPGVFSGRPEGVIDGNSLIPIIESIGLLGPSAALSQAEQDGLEDWFSKLAVWLATSENGKAERAKSNNHGIYYDLMLTHFALFARLDKVPQQMAASFPARRIALQFAPDGTLPEELSRTRSWHYTHWTLQAASQMAQLGECVGVDIWNFKTTDGRGLRTSFNWIAQFAGNERKWKYREIAFDRGGKIDGAREGALESLRTAAWGLRDPTLELAAQTYAKTQRNADVHRWLSPYEPKQR
jgi:hypothetical protein